MGTVCSEHFELIALNPSDPASQSRGLTVSLPTVWIFVHRQSHCSLWKLRDRSEGKPDARSFFDQAGEDKSHNWQPDHEASNRVKHDTDLQ
jgi:hypothetical protein